MIKINTEMMKMAALASECGDKLKLIGVKSIKQDEHGVDVEMEADRFRKMFPDADWTSTQMLRMANFWVGNVYFSAYETIENDINNGEEELPFEDRVEEAERKYDERYDELLGVLDD